jgi:hypothetical protein
MSTSSSSSSSSSNLSFTGNINTRVSTNNINESNIAIARANNNNGNSSSANNTTHSVEDIEMRDVSPGANNLNLTGDTLEGISETNTNLVTNTNISDNISDSSSILIQEETHRFLNYIIYLEGENLGALRGVLDYLKDNLFDIESLKIYHSIGTHLESEISILNSETLMDMQEVGGAISGLLHYISFIN